MRLLMKGTYNKNATPMALGWSYMNDTVKWDQIVDMSGDNGMVINCTWNTGVAGMILGWNKKWKSVTKPMEDVKWGAGLTGHFDKKLCWGVGVNGTSKTLADTKVNDATLYFNHAGAKNTAGAEMKYD